MSSWVDKQRQEAFSVYRPYIGMDLHFRDGSNYDYTLYNGNTKVTAQAFLKKSPQEILLFMKLSQRLKRDAIPVEEFLFSNARYGTFDIRSLVQPSAFQIYNNWKESYGDTAVFQNSVSVVMKEIQTNIQFKFDSISDIVIYLLDKDDGFLETICWIIQNAPQETITKANIKAEENIFHKMKLQRVLKIQKMYSYLGII